MDQRGLDGKILKIHHILMLRKVSKMSGIYIILILGVLSIAVQLLQTSCHQIRMLTKSKVNVARLNEGKMITEAPESEA